MKLSYECQTLIGKHFRRNVIPSATTEDKEKALKIFRKNIIKILEELEVEIKAANHLVIINKLHFTIDKDKNRPINLSSQEVALIQKIVDKIFHSDLCLHEHPSLQKLQKSSLHPSIFPKKPRGPISVTGTIRVRSRL